MKVTGEVEQVKSSADALRQLKERFAAWRAARKLGTRIPPQLWAAAVEMVGAHGAYRVARALNLDYELVKQRAAVADRHVKTTELAPRFVELFTAGGATPAQGASLPQCVVELANARGARMRVELNGQGVAGLPALCSAFLGAP